MSFPITTVILTHRADQRFTQALASVQWADEILVFDNDSQNDWKKLKKKYALSVKKIPEPVQNFAKIRNQALSEAQHDWVFFLDSDEVFPKKAEQALQTLLAKHHPKNLGAVSFPRKDIFHGKKLRFGETGNNRVTRLLHKHRARFVRPVHETVRTSFPVIDSTISLAHFAHVSLSAFMKDVTRYAKIEADLRKHQSLVVVFFQIFVFPVGKFLLNFVGKLGFLDGWRGLGYAMMMSLHSLLVRIYIYENLARK